MSQKLIPEPIVNPGFEQRWAAWQARGAEHERETRRKLFLLAVALVLSGVFLSGWLWPL